MSMILNLHISDLSKSYNETTVFENWSCQLYQGNIIGITGSNGSGKSTLIKIIAGLVKPDKGNCQYYIDGIQIENKQIYKHIGFVSPYLELYGELSITEHYKIISKIKKTNSYENNFKQLLELFNISESENKPINHFSSGMIQKSKLTLALTFCPTLLLLDEPFSNLDEHSIQITRDLITNDSTNRISIIASNDSRELMLCQTKLPIKY